MARLTCIFGKCELEVLTLNQCGKDSFWPAVERVTSEGPEMSISDDGKRLEIRVHNNEYSATHTISYTKDSGDVLVTNYSGGFTKYSDILEKVIAVEYVPVRSIDGGRWATWKLDCDVQIPVMPGKASR